MAFEMLRQNFHYNKINKMSASEKLLHLRDENSLVRSYAWSLMNNWNDHKPVLYSLQFDKEYEIRIRAGSVLASLNDEKVEESLDELLHSNLALTGLYYIMHVQFLDLRKRTRKSSLDFSSHVEVIIELLSAKTSEKRLAACMVLGMIHDSRVVEPLISCLLNEVDKAKLNQEIDYAHVEGAACAALGRQKDERAILPLIEIMFKSSDPETQESACQALSDFMHEDLVKLLLERMSYSRNFGSPELSYVATTIIDEIEERNPSQ